MPYPHSLLLLLSGTRRRRHCPLLASCAPAEAQAVAADALLLTGGGDLCPEYYAYHVPLSCISPFGTGPDAYEIALFRAFLAAKESRFLVFAGGCSSSTCYWAVRLWEDLS